jgi:hypothetical protein
MIHAAANAGSSSSAVELFAPAILVCIVAVIIVVLLLISYDAIFGDKKDQENTYNNRY